MLVDIHTHYLAPGDWGTEWTDNWKPAYGYDWPEPSTTDFDEAMSSVDVAVVFGIRATRAGVGVANAHLAQFCAAAQTKTIGFMALDFSDPDVLDQLEEGLDLGLRGVKLYPVLAGFDPMDRAFDDLYARIAGLGLPVLWHMGASASPTGILRYSNPLVLDEVAGRHPDLIQIIAHMGHPWQRETVILCRKHANVYTDVSGQWARPLDGLLALYRSYEWGVGSKLLFGSDYPLWTPEGAVAALRQTAARRLGDFPAIPDDYIEELLTRNPLPLLNLD